MYDSIITGKENAFKIRVKLYYINVSDEFKCLLCVFFFGEDRLATLY